MSAPSAAPRHFLELPDAQTIRTREFALAERAVKDLAARNAMGLIYGDAGFGKSYAVAQVITSIEPPLHWMVFAEGTTPKQLTTTLLELTTGVRQEGTQHVLGQLLLDALSEQSRTIVIDEAQHLRYACVEYLRHLHDHPCTRFSLVLVGGNGCWDLLRHYPMLRSRLFRRVEFKRLDRKKVLRAMPGFHPIYNGASSELIELIDDAFCRGNFRDWASITLTLRDLMPDLHAPELTREIIANGLELHGDPDDATRD